MENQHHPERHARLQDLASKSWNLELIISGAAIYLVAQVPAVIDGWLRYYLDNLMLDTDLQKIQLPLLAYSFAKVISWILIANFIAHFAMRAFWVGLVGLHAVYPEGIQYDNLPRNMRSMKDAYKRNFGLLSDFIVRLDRLSNQVFSFAFLIALLGLGIAIIYVIIFAVTTIIPLVAGGAKIGIVILSLVLAFLTILPVIGKLLSKFSALKDKPWVQRFIEWANITSRSYFLPFVYRPMLYINLTFQSNISKMRFYGTMGLSMIFVIGGVLWVFLGITFELRNIPPMSTLSYFAKGKDEYTMIAERYDNLRTEGQSMPTVSIQEDRVKGSTLRVFVAYPKYLDAALAKFCTTPVWPDSIKGSLRRHLNDSIHTQCLSRFFRVTVNDSLYTPPDWMFYTHPQTDTKGLVTYLPAARFHPGKNVLRVRIPTAEKADSLEQYGVVPFWYEL
jgi:hypothetical protein